MTDETCGTPESPLISVIVPVYNVAPWLDQCIESIVKQTYQHLEIILVDDGSTDISGEICDAWANKDSRIQVIHKTNGGLSEARNFGIEAAKGSYLSFIDSDDWIDLSMLEILYKAIKDHGANMAVCGWRKIAEDRIEEYRETATRTVSGEEAIQAMLDGQFPFCYSFVWNKLYARDIWETLRFPVGKRFEDGWVRSLVYHRCHKIAVTDKMLYFYRWRKGSISYDPSVRNYLAILEANVSECAFLQENYPQFQAGIDRFIMEQIIEWIMLCYEENGGKRFPSQTEAQLTRLVRRYKKAIWYAIPCRRRIKYTLFSFSPRWMFFFRKFYLIYKERVKSI